MSEHDQSSKFAENAVSESEAIIAARHDSLELGITHVSQGVGAALAVAAAACQAVNILEVGTGVGVSALWLLSGSPLATLTSIDSEPEYLVHARNNLSAAGYPAARTRLIAGKGGEVLPRMNEGAYDLVFIDADLGSVMEYVEHGVRLVRAGGSVIVANALGGGQVANLDNHEAEAVAVRALLDELTSSPVVVVALSPIGGGLLHIVRKH